MDTEPTFLLMGRDREAGSFKVFRVPTEYLKQRLEDLSIVASGRKKDSVNISLHVEKFMDVRRRGKTVLFGQFAVN